MPRKKLNEFIDDMAANVSVADDLAVAAPYKDPVISAVEVVPFWRVTFVYLEDFQLTGDRRKELVQDYLDKTQPGFAIDRAFKNGLVIVDEHSNLLHLPPSRILQAKVERLGG